MPITSTIPILGAPDYRDWFSIFNHGSDQEKNWVFQRDILPCLAEYTAGTLFSTAIEQNEWLREFLKPGENFIATMAEFNQHPNEATITITNYVNYMAGTVIAVAWQENMRDYVTDIE
jgi:hypothetical protein